MGRRGHPVHVRNAIILKTMSAAYDNYDYPSYWLERSYEHNSELLAIRSILEKIPKIKKGLEIGAGYGRLLPAYCFRTKKIILSDPSAKLLSIARNKNKKEKKIVYLQSKLENLPVQTKQRDFDLIIMVRVLHHITNVAKAFEIINKLLNKNGYLILEFANKTNLKATVRQFFKGNLTYPLEIDPIDLRSKKSKKMKTLPFINYHPDQIIEMLENSGFEILEKRSVSNIRSCFLKRTLPLNLLIDLERALQKPLSAINFGPSIFILAKKEDR